MATHVSQSSGANGTGTTLTWALPAGWQPGDLVLFAGHMNATVSYLPVTGWIQQKWITRASGQAGAAVVLSRVMQAGDVAPEIQPSSAVAWDAWVADCFRLDVDESGWGTIAAANIAVPAVAATSLPTPSAGVGGTQKVVSWAAHLTRQETAQTGATLHSAPAGWVEATDISTGGTAVNQIGAMSMYANEAGPGTVSPGAATASVPVWDFGVHVVVATVEKVVVTEMTADEYPLDSFGRPSTSRRATADAPDVPTASPTDGVITGAPAGVPLLSEEGRGVRNGVPYGEALQAEETALRKQYLFSPGPLGRLRAATRRALGR